jgi:TonB-dependent SusC/RagA subfamily outer membrane receptor
VTSEDLRNSNEPIEVILQRKVPGLKVTRTSDGGIALNIRGATSFMGGSTAPLYILDGLPFQPGPEGAITGVNPDDISSVKVLKGAEAAIYGSAGADGVIVITTKLGAGSTDMTTKP